MTLVSQGIDRQQAYVFKTRALNHSATHPRHCFSGKCRNCAEKPCRRNPLPFAFQGLRPNAILNFKTGALTTRPNRVCWRPWCRWIASSGVSDSDMRIRRSVLPTILMYRSDRDSRDQPSQPASGACDCATSASHCSSPRVAFHVAWTCRQFFWKPLGISCLQGRDKRARAIHPRFSPANAGTKHRPTQNTATGSADGTVAGVGRPAKDRNGTGSARAILRQATMPSVHIPYITEKSSVRCFS